MKKVTIVTPTFKRSHILGKTVQSILNQTYKNFELIILDDNNSNDTEEIEKTRNVITSFNDPRVAYIKNTTNLGHPNIFNKCLEYISGEYFMLFGDDDELLEDSLEYLVNYLDNNPEASLSHGLDMFKDEDGNIFKAEPLVEKEGLLDAELYLNSILSIKGSYAPSLSAALFRSEIITVNKIKIFGSYQWDVFFFCQYFLHAKKVGYLNKYMDIRNASVHHTGKNGSSLYLFYIQIENLYLILKFINEYSFALVAKDYNINKFRFIIIKMLFQRFIHFKDKNKAFLCFEIALKNLIKLGLIYTLYYPFKIFFKILWRINLKKE